MLRDHVSAFSLLFIVATCSSTYASEGKNYLEELEEAFVAKIQQSNKHSNHTTLEKNSGDTSEDENEDNDIGRKVAIDIKESFNEAKAFFALGQWSSWEKTKIRFEKAEKAINKFKTKYSSQLAKTSLTKEDTTTKVTKEEEATTKITETTQKKEEEEETEEVPNQPTTTTSLPIAPSSMPGMGTQPVSPSMPTAPTSPMSAPVTKPNTPVFPIMQKPATPVVQTPQAPTMPKTPTSSTTTMPGMTSKPAVGPGGMPLA